MERLFLIRHGETDSTAAKKFMGKTDVPLNKSGRRQVSRLARRLKNEDISVFYASPLKRTFETAEILQAFHKASIKKCRDLEEIGFGRWEGLTMEEIYERDENLCRKWFESFESVTIPGGESIRNMHRRIKRAWTDIFRRHPKGTVAVVTHGGPLRILLCTILDLDISFFWKVQFSTSSLTVFEFCGNSATLTLLNDISHIK